MRGRHSTARKYFLLIHIWSSMIYAEVTTQSLPDNSHELSTIQKPSHILISIEMTQTWIEAEHSFSRGQPQVTTKIPHSLRPKKQLLLPRSFGLINAFQHG